MEFNVLATEHVIRHMVSPLVDTGHMQSDHVSGLLSQLITSQTDHSCAGDSSVVDSSAVIPLMFGQLTAGLRQLTVRTILSHILFSCSPEDANKKLDHICKTQGHLLNQLLVKPSLTRYKDKNSDNDSVMAQYEYELELGSELEYSSDRGHVFNNTTAVSNTTENTADDVEAVELSDAAVSDINNSDDDQTVSELMDTIATIDRELEVIKTECELDSIDRDLASWETELLATLERIERYHEQLGRTHHSVETARRRSEELIQELRVQRRILDQSEKDIEDTEAEIEASIAQEDDEQDERVVVSTESSTPRRWIDENWSLGSERVLAATHDDTSDDDSFRDDIEAGDDPVNEIVSTVCQRFSSLLSENIALHNNEPESASGVTHTDTLVRTLTVAANYNDDDHDEADDGKRMWQQYRDTVRESEDNTESARSSSSASDNDDITFRFPLHSFRSPPVPPHHMFSSSSDDSETDDDDDEHDSEQDSDTWGGTFSLRHTRKQAEHSESSLMTQASLVSRLTPRTLFSLTDHLGIPHSLRPLFSVEAARLQLCLSLFCHKSITCDRNCEGESL